jgi:hypothetical protein
MKKEQHGKKLQEQAKAEVAMRSLILERDSIKRKERVKEILSSKKTGNEEKQNKHMTALDVFEQLTPAKALELSPEKQVLSNHSNLGSALALQPTKKQAFIPYDKQGEVIELVDFEWIEPRDRDSLKIAMTKNNAILKYLFDRYSIASGDIKASFGTHMTPQKMMRSEIMTERNINQKELMRMLKDHGIDFGMISKHEIKVTM